MKKIFITPIVASALMFFPASQTQSAETVDLDRIVVTASRIEQYDYKTTSNISVITEKEIEESGTQTIPELLESEVGLYVYNKSTSKSTIADLRGFGDTSTRNILVLINNRKINEIDISAPDLMQLPLEAVKKIEIIRGAGSVLYGDNAVGGVINIITKEGKGPLSGKIGSFYGSYDTRGSDFEISGEKKDISYYLYSKYHDNHGYRQNSDVLTKDFYGRFGYTLSEKMKFDLNLNYHKDTYGLPGGLDDQTELASLGRRGSANEDDSGKTTDRSVQFTMDVTPWPEDIDYGRFVLDFSFRNRDNYSAFPSLSDFNTHSGIDTYGFNGKYIFDKTIFNQDMDLVLGIDMYDSENAIVGSQGNSDNLKIAKKEFGIYLFSEFELLNNLFVNGGTRYQKAEYVFDQFLATRYYDTKDTGEQVTMGGMKYEYGKGSNVFWNVQQTYRLPSTDEWYTSAYYPPWVTPGLNTGLEPQRGVEYEIGLKHNFDNKIVLGITPYLMDLRNEIYYDLSTGQNTNYDKTRRSGVESSLNIDLCKLLNIDFLDKLDFFTNYTFQKAEFNGGSNDHNRIPMVPVHQLNHGLTVGFWDHFVFGLYGHYVGSQFAINDLSNTQNKLKAHYTMDAKLSYENDSLEVYTRINNITNELYNTFAAYGSFPVSKLDYFPAPETNFVFGMKYKF